MTKGERNAGKEIGKVSIAPDVYELLEVSLKAVGQVTEDDNRPYGRHERCRLHNVLHVEWDKGCPVNSYRSFVTQSSYSLYPMGRSV